MTPSRFTSSEDPWCTNDERLVDQYYRRVCEDVMRATGSLSRTEWDHYGSGYASFVDAWFYKPTAQFAVPFTVEEGEGYIGLVVLLSRSSPYFVFMEGQKLWHEKGGSGYLPTFEGVDELSCPGVFALAEQVQPLLEERRLHRLRRADLSAPLPQGTRVPTILTDPPYTEFDALFFWED